MEQLKQLILETCKYPPGSLERQTSLTKLIIAIKRSKKLWWENTPYYQDALQKTWIFFCQNLCTVYDSKLSTVTTWLNRYLKWRLKDFYLEGKANPGVSSNDAIIDNLVAKPDIPPMLENTLQWAKQDPSGELRRIHIKGYPQITCQILILHRLPPETSWKELSTEFGLSISTLSNFYRRECMPRLRNFGKSEGYLN